MKTLDLSIFAIPFFLFLRPFLRKRASLRELVILQFEKDKNRGLRGAMKEAVFFFTLTSVFSGYAFYRAELSYLWLAISIIFLGMAAIMSFVLIYQHYAKQDVPKFPDTISEQWIEKKMKEKKRNRYIWLGVLVVWTYSWRSLFNL